MKFEEALEGIMAGEIWSCDGIKYWYGSGGILHTVYDEDEDSASIESKLLASEDWMKVDCIFILTFFEAMEKAKEGKKVTNVCLCHGHLASTDKMPYYKVATDGNLRYYNRDGSMVDAKNICYDEIKSMWGVLEE